MLTIFLFLPLLMVFMFMNLSVRAIILSAFTLLPVSAIWMGYNLDGFLVHENKKNWSWTDVAMLLVYSGVVVGLVIAGSWTLELLQLY